MYTYTFYKTKKIPGNRGDMQKIHVTRHFFEASGRHGDFFEKTNNPFLDKVYGSMCTVSAELDAGFYSVILPVRTCV